MTIYDDIAVNITGRVAITKLEADYVENLLKDKIGTHVEIGTLWGGTAILAALAKTAGQVITIDMMKDCYWKDGDPDAGFARPSADVILDNLARFKVAHRVSIYKGYSDPFPFDIKPETAFIDGAHEYDGVKQDWQNLKHIVTSLIIFHDYGDTHPGVKQAVDEIKDRNWKRIKAVGSLAVFERVK